MQTRSPYIQTIGRLAIATALAIAGGMLLLSSDTPVAQRVQATSTSDANVLRIGYQKGGSLILLKSQGTLDKLLAPLGFTVQWTLFPAGPQLLEAMNVGSIDFGTTGEAPPVFAQAAGTPLVYVAYEAASPRGEAILVPKNSPIHTVAQLKGKTVVLNKGSNVHYLLVEALARAGLKYSDIHTVYLPPADARPAFERGSADAWVIWDPYFGIEQEATGARILTDGTGLVANHQFYEATKSFVTAHPSVIKAVIQAIQTTDTWTKKNIQQAAKFQSADLGIPASILAMTFERTNYGAYLISDDVIAQQQKIADTFYALGLIPTHIRVKDAEWSIHTVH